MKKWKQILVIIFMLICFIGLGYSTYNIYIWKINVSTNEKIKDDINKTVVEFTVDSIGQKDYVVNFSSLKEQNSDTVGYLKVNNTNIEYVVTKANDNKYYLSHNFNREYNIAGWIFSDYKNRYDGTDKNIVIYGHNIKNGSMFGTLKSVLTSDWQQNSENLEVSLITEIDSSLYQVFSTYMIAAEDYYITTEFNNDDDYLKFLNTIKNRSNYNYGVEVDVNDQILTLSTCNDSGNKRIVLHAKKMRDIDT